MIATTKSSPVKKGEVNLGDDFFRLLILTIKGYWMCNTYRAEFPAAARIVRALSTRIWKEANFQHKSTPPVQHARGANKIPTKIANDRSSFLQLALLL